MHSSTNARKVAQHLATSETLQILKHAAKLCSDPWTSGIFASGAAGLYASFGNQVPLIEYGEGYNYSQAWCRGICACK